MVSNILNAAVSGLSASAQQVGASADNIANVSTHGYKRTAIYPQSVSTRQSATAYVPGGVQAISRQLNDVQGLLAPSTTSTDLAISGSGYFAVSPSSQGDTVVFTREGSFAPDSEGYLVNTSGHYLLATSTNNTRLQPVNVARIGPAASDEGDLSSVSVVSVSQNGSVSATFENGEQRRIADIEIATFANPAGLEALSGNVYQATGSSGEAQYRTPGQDGAGTVQSGALELSTTDVGTEFANLIVAQNTYRASLSAIKAADELSQSLLDEVV